MRDSQTLIDDLMTLGSGLLSQLVEARHELKAQAADKFGDLAQRLDIVTREEFDAAFAMLQKARALQDDILRRLDALEGKKQPARKANGKTQTSKRSLPSVKKARNTGKARRKH